MPLVTGRQTDRLTDKQTDTEEPPGPGWQADSRAAYQTDNTISHS